eukprot:6475437-Ditylum_brightwellii.AAC.1
MDYTKHTVTQVSKRAFKGATTTIDDATIMSLDIKDMHPLIGVKLIQKTLAYYAINLSEEEKKIDNCTNLVKF